MQMPALWLPFRGETKLFPKPSDPCEHRVSLCSPSCLLLIPHLTLICSWCPPGPAPVQSVCPDRLHSAQLTPSHMPSAPSSSYSIYFPSILVVKVPLQSHVNFNPLSSPVNLKAGHSVGSVHTCSTKPMLLAVFSLKKPSLFCSKTARPQERRNMTGPILRVMCPVCYSFL